MTKEWEKDLDRSTKIFKDSVYPKINELLGGGELIPVEAVTDSDMADQLDQLAGVDFWYVDTEVGMYGLASRVQDGGTDWSTFTVRRKRFNGATTEFEKRKNQIEQGYLYPKYTCQAYTDGYEFLNVAVVDTKSLINYIDGGVEGDDYIIRATHNADFFVVDWSDLGSQCNVHVYAR